MNVSLSTIKRTIAATEVLLIFPAALFLAALLVRQAQPERYEPAHTAQRIVAWYAARPWTLWVLLIALPFAVLASGSATLLRGWNDDAEQCSTQLSPTCHPPWIFPLQQVSILIQAKR